MIQWGSLDLYDFQLNIWTICKYIFLLFTFLEFFFVLFQIHDKYYKGQCTKNDSLKKHVYRIGSLSLGLRKPIFIIENCKNINLKNIYNERSIKNISNKKIYSYLLYTEKFVFFLQQKWVPGSLNFVHNFQQIFVYTFNRFIYTYNRQSERVLHKHIYTNNNEHSIDI